MKTTKRSNLRFPMLLGYMMVIASMLACAVLAGGGGTQAEGGSLQLEDGVVKVKMETGEWVPVAGKATFELVGKLEGTDPWTVSGKTFITNETTKIDEGLQVDDIVRVRGTVLDNDTWLAYSIERTEEQTDPVIVLIGVVDSIDPWVVNGIQLNVSSETEIQGEIKPGMLVRVIILLREDGTWEVLRIALLGEQTETSGCVTVVATVVSVTGNEIQFLGWPTVVVFDPGVQQNVDENNNQSGDDDEDNDEGEDNDEDGNGNENGEDEITSIHTGDTVSAVVCASVDGQLIIVLIIVIDADEEGNTSTEGAKVLVCHKPDKKGGHTISISSSAVPAHLAHGDTLGACP